MSKREEFLATPLKRKQITVDPWGEITIQRFNGVVRDEIDEALNKAEKEGHSKVRALAIVKSVVDGETGQMMFTDADIPALCQIDALVADRVFGEIAKFNGMVAGAVEDAEGN